MKPPGCIQESKFCGGENEAGASTGLASYY
jgi:hypothetical protein